MEEGKRIAINAGVGFGLTAGLYLLVGESVELALGFGVFVGIGFAIAIWLLARFEERREPE